jgi:hypothetical protein
LNTEIFPISAMDIAGKYIAVGVNGNDNSGAYHNRFLGKLKKNPFKHDSKMGIYSSARDSKIWVPYQVYNVDNYFSKFWPPSRVNSIKFRDAFFSLEYADLLRSKKPDLYMRLHGDLIDDDVYFWLEKAGIEKDSKEGEEYIVKHVTRKLKGELLKTPPLSEFLFMATSSVCMGTTGSFQNQYSHFPDIKSQDRADALKNTFY